MIDRVYIVAEAGVNHDGSLAQAIELVEIAARAGADAVKFQSFKTSSTISRSAPKAEYQKHRTGSAESQYEMVRKLELNAADHLLLRNHCRKRNIQFLSTPFDLWSLDLLVRKCRVERIKIASGEITNAPLLLKAAQSGRKVILSTGMSTLGEVESALGVLAFGYMKSRSQPSEAGFHSAFCSSIGQHLLRQRVVLLHCTTEYPAPFEDVNLRAMDTLASAFGLPVGLSDHTRGLAVPIAAVARGARLVEKHFTIDRSLPGPDHQASLEPDELVELVESIRQVEKAVGQPIKIPAASEIKNTEIARKSLVAARNIKKGERFTARNIAVKRPGSGISPMKYWETIGLKADRDYDLDDMIG
jgi:N-acetylneuraminate synthase